MLAARVLSLHVEILEYLLLMGCLISYQSFSSGSPNPLSEFNPGIWLGVWIGLAVTGGIIQWQVERRSVDRELEEEF